MGFLLLTFLTATGGIVHPSAGTGVGGAGIILPASVASPVKQKPGGAGGIFQPGAGVGPGGVGYPYGGGYAFPYGVGTGLGAGTGVGTLPGAKPLKPPAVGGAGGAGIPLAARPQQGGYYPYGQSYGQGGLLYPAGVGLGAAAGAKGPKPGYGNLGAGGGYQPGAGVVNPGYGGGYPSQFYPNAGNAGGYVPAPLTPQQAKAAKYGALQGFLGGAGGVYRGGAAGCQGKYCGRRK
ncbi:uncharacterized protein LOC142995320 [Genypterus blacodes]|uniref:uncharacterized protein LOC142995320 n=1 Tax=Genypterus blacodes TaxID=154954 RepID=UPI003F76D1A4